MTSLSTTSHEQPLLRCDGVRQSEKETQAHSSAPPCHDQSAKDPVESRQIVTEHRLDLLWHLHWIRDWLGRHLQETGGRLLRQSH